MLSAAFSAAAACWLEALTGHRFKGFHGFAHAQGDSHKPGRDVHKTHPPTDPYFHVVFNAALPVCFATSHPWLGCFPAHQAHWDQHAPGLHGQRSVYVGVSLAKVCH